MTDEETEQLLESLDYIASEGDRYRDICRQAAATIRDMQRQLALVAADITTEPKP